MSLTHKYIEPTPYAEDFITEEVKKARPVTSNDVVRLLPNGARRFLESGQAPGKAPEVIQEYLQKRDLVRANRQFGKIGPLIYTDLGKQVVGKLVKRGRGNL